MSKYGNMCGLWTLDISGYNKEIKLKVGDSRKFLKLVATDTKDKSVLFDKFADYIYEIIKRNDAPQTQEEDEELRLFIDMNLLGLLNETMIAFKLTTREDIEAQKKKMVESISGESIGN